MSHRSAPVEVRERVAFPPCAGRGFLRRLKDEGVVSEAVLLSTCNRTEVYAVVEDDGARGRVLDLLAEDRGLGRASLEQDTYWLTDAEAVRHLYRVASSLDSMVVGEGQILGQVREADRRQLPLSAAGRREARRGGLRGAGRETRPGTRRWRHERARGQAPERQGRHRPTHRQPYPRTRGFAYPSGGREGRPVRRPRGRATQG